jgi:hypothetical protein
MHQQPRKSYQTSTAIFDRFQIIMLHQNQTHKHLLNISATLTTTSKQN